MDTLTFTLAQAPIYRRVSGDDRVGSRLVVFTSRDGETSLYGYDNSISSFEWDSDEDEAGLPTKIHRGLQETVIVIPVLPILLILLTLMCCLFKNRICQSSSKAKTGDTTSGGSGEQSAAETLDAKFSPDA